MRIMEGYSSAQIGSRSDARSARDRIRASSWNPGVFLEMTGKGVPMTAVSSDLFKAVIVAFGGHLIVRDMGHTGGRRSLQHPGQHVVYGFVVALDQRLHIPVGMVSDPAAQTQLMGLPHASRPETDALDFPFDDDRQRFNRIVAR